MLTLDDIADLMAVSRRTVHRLIGNGQFPAADMRLSKRLQRWRPATVEKALSKIGR
jgi:excisionase family DNA binding protein